MDNLSLLVSYHSVNGGVNNLQVVKVVKPSPYRGLVEIVKTFSSKKHLALERAKNYVKEKN